MKENFGRKIGVSVLVILLMTAIISCTREGLGTIDNGNLHFDEITSIEVSTRLAADETINLNEKEIEDFVSLVNSFTMKRDDEAQSDKYGTPFIFTLKQSDGSEAELHFFDRILTINGEKRYRMTDGDGTMLADYCDHICLNGPDLVRICRRYIDSTDMFFVKDRIDYSIYEIKKMTLDEYQSMTFETDEKITTKNIDRYRMVIVGDTAEHNFAVILVDAENREVKGYAPIK